jgi:hypothetical protein
MLINKPFSEGDTITIKTMTGEEVIASFIKEDAETITVHKPLVLASDSRGVVLAQYLYTVDPDKQIRLNKPVCLMEQSSKEASDLYLQSTTSLVLR